MICICIILHTWCFYSGCFLAPSEPLNIIVSPANATVVNVMWDEPAKPGGIINNYTITISTITMNNSVFVKYTDLSDLTVNIYGLIPNTNYIINITAVRVEPGDAASLSFTTPSCKCVIVLMCYVMYCFD